MELLPFPLVQIMTPGIFSFKSLKKRGLIEIHKIGLQWVQTEVQEILFNPKKKLFYCKRVIKHWLSERDILGDTQNPTRHSTEHAVGGFGLSDLQRCLPPSVTPIL